MKKLLLITILGLFTAISTLAQGGFPQNGTCGENLIWHLDTESGVLTISGTGDMTTFYQAPWPTMLIKQANIADGVTSIGHSAFRDCFYLTSITIPNTVTSIGAVAFSSCRSLSDIDIPDSVTSIGTQAFYSCHSFNSVDIPASVTNIEHYAFSYCSGITEITVRAVVPPVVKGSAFDNINASSITVYVPQESLEEYQNAYLWSRFNLQGVVYAGVAKNVLEGISIFTQNREIIISGIEQPEISVYDVNGRIVASGAMNRIAVAKTGVYLVRVKGCTVKVLVS